MDFKNTLLLVLVAACVGLVSPHTVHMGRTCPEVDPFPNLSLDKILGVWYVVYQFDTSNTCLVWNITRVGEERLAITETRQLWLLDSLRIDHQHLLTATLDIPNPEVPARMRIRWPTSITGKADFTIFDTDYQEYMAVFECDRAGLIHRRSVTILSRASVMNQMFVDRIRRILDTKNIPHAALNIIDHNICREQGQYSWHTEGELFGLLSRDASQTQEQRLASGVEGYDISQLEILGDGVLKNADGTEFKGSIKVPRST
ncbi:Lipocalin/cytosolic fatty-acid binding domain [Trinorchestia longiramus]|nr:Lipocalin/cytosolic fatty-acid binding domain [Trinorchestia longiramus]